MTTEAEVGVIYLEDGGRSHKPIQAASGIGIKQEMDPPLEPPKGPSPGDTLTLAQGN